MRFVKLRNTYKTPDESFQHKINRPKYKNFQKLKLPFPHHVFFFSFLPASPFLFSFPLPVPCLSFPVLLLTHHSSQLDRQPPKRMQDQSVASEKRNERDRAIFSVSKWQMTIYMGESRRAKFINESDFPFYNAESIKRRYIIISYSCCFSDRERWAIFTARCYTQSAVFLRYVVCLSVCSSVTLVDCDHIVWNFSKIISGLLCGVHFALWRSPTSRIYFTVNTRNFGRNRGGWVWK